MKNLNILVFFLLHQLVIGQELPPTGDAVLPKLPLLIHWDQSDFRIQAVPSELSPANQLAATSSKCFDYLSEDMVRIKAGSECSSILFNFSAPSSVSRSIDPPIVMKGIDARIKGNLQGDDLLVSINGYDPEDSQRNQLLVFRGLDVILVESDPRVVAQRETNTVHLEVSKADIQMLLFKGGKIHETQITNAIPQLGMKYNKKFVEYDSFVYEEKGTVGRKWDSEHVRNLVNKYNITDFRDEPLLYLEDMLVTKKGIGLTLQSVHVRAKARKRPVSLFFRWKDFIHLELESYKDDRQLQLITPQKEVYLFRGTHFYSNVELIQFMKELRNLILYSMHPLQLSGKQEDKVY